MQHGGSGLNFTPRDVYELDFSDALWFAETLDDVREKEARAIEKASKSGRR